ncbi:MAG: hypothetical protein HYU69_06190 [Bacteroidetes bacterium]|nr:hypothetical protein [Bacteroidota bacterium]
MSLRFAFFLSILAGALCAQQKNIPLSYDSDWLYNFTDNKNPGQQPIHSGFRPAIENQEKHFLSEYSFRNLIDLATQLDSTYLMPARSKFIKRKLKQESLIIINDTNDKFHFTIDPLFNFQLGRGNDGINSENLYTNTRGFMVRGDIGKNLSFESSFYENQSTFPDYISTYADLYKVIPGQGRWKKFKTNGYDYAMAAGYLSYTPNKHINVQLGHGKHFVGDGYRSLLLSDNAFNYPHLRVTTTFGKIQYTNLYAVFINLSNGHSITSLGSEPLFQKKAASFQFLNWNVHKRIQLGLFQGIIWEAADSKNRQNLDVNYFNPVIFTNSLVYSLNNTNNVLLGSTLKLKIFKNLSIYGQYVLDGYDVKGSVFNKQGFQVGFKGHNLFTAKNLSILMEYNQVRPYTYASIDPEQSYSHYNQPLAHPLGANFREFTGILSYRYKDFISRAKLTYASIGTNNRFQILPFFPQPLGSTMGNNIFVSDISAVNGINSTNNFQNQGEQLTIVNIDFSISYIVNPVTNMQLTAGFIYRDGDPVNGPFTMPYISFKTSLSNLYYDF